MAGRPVAVAGGQRIAAKGATGGAVLVDPRRDRGRRTRLSQQSDANGSIYGDTAARATGYVYLGQQSLAKYYEYSIVAPGAFGGGHVATGSSDGLYQIDLWANNVASNFQGFSDQSYMLTASKAGEQYLTFDLGSDAACVQHQRADTVYRSWNQQADVAGRRSEQAARHRQ